MVGEYQKQWEFLKGKFEADQLSHAYVFSGADEIGKSVFAKEFTKLINCQSYKTDDRQFCKTDRKLDLCQSCKLIEKGNFPDMCVIKSENSKSSLKDKEDKQEIDVLLIRETQHFLSYKSYYGNYKVVIIENAERMNTDAADCFLKNLEEPKGKTLIILLSSKPQMLLPTIVSRCQEIKFAHSGNYGFSPEENTIVKKISPVLLATLAEKFLYAKSTKLDNGNFSIILDALQKYFRQLLLVKIGVSETPPLTIVGEYTVGKLKKIIRLIDDLLRQSLVGNVNPKLALEILLLEL